MRIGIHYEIADLSINLQLNLIFKILTFRKMHRKFQNFSMRTVSKIKILIKYCEIRANKMFDTF